MKFIIIALIYLFFNRLGLPFGLEYTMLLAPILYIQIFRKYALINSYFFILVIPFFIAHTFIGIENEEFYLKSTFLHLITFILAFSFYDYLKNNTIPEKLYKTASIFAFILALIAIVFLLLGNLDVFWKIDTVSFSISEFPRFRGLTYEPAYFAYLLTPVFFYYFDRIFLKKETQKLKYLVLIILPLLISFSFSFIACSLISIILTILFKGQKGKQTSVRFIFILIIALLISIIFFPNNLLFMRLNDFLNGMDVSGQARIFDPWIIAQYVLEQKSAFWGIGFGQYKIIGHDFVNEMYNYMGDVRIGTPNAVFDTLITFGYIGLFIRLSLLIYLFKKTKVLKSNFRTLIFFYAFIFQFVGGYLAMLPEYVMWIIAFNKKEQDEETN